MEFGQKVNYIDNQGIKSDIECELIEDLGDFLRIKKPTGEMIRIFRDRVCAVNKQQQVSEKTMEKEQFDPWHGLSENSEVWVKSPSFNDTVICKIYAIIDPNDNEYKSINTYDGIAHKTMVYPMKSYASLINKLQKRGYEKSGRNS